MNTPDAGYERACKVSHGLQSCVQPEVKIGLKWVWVTSCESKRRTPGRLVARFPVPSAPPMGVLVGGRSGLQCLGGEAGLKHTVCPMAALAPAYRPDRIPWTLGGAGCALPWGWGRLWKDLASEIR